MVVEARKPRGFAAISAERRREIARMGGKKVHALGLGHRFTVEEAKSAGKKGGKAAHAAGKAHKWTSETARDAGRKGGRGRKVLTEAA